MNQNKIIKSYIFGFVLSIVLTLSSYFIVVNRVLSSDLLITFIIGFALIQLCVQLVFFLHILQEKNPRWNLVFFLSTFSIILLVVIASLWIMDNLNYNMMPEEMSNYIIEKEGIYR